MKNLDTTPRISVDEQAAPWETSTPTIWSLWTLLETYAWNLVSVTETIVWLREGLSTRLASVKQGIRNLDGIDITDTDRQSIEAIFEHVKLWLEAHTLTASLDSYKRILDETLHEEPDIHTIIAGLKNFTATLEDELRRRVFLYISPEDLSFYKTPEAFFPLTVNAFPASRYDIAEAGRCFALGRYTASVYHSMGVVQAGLHALATELGVTFTHSLDLAEWNGIINALETAIKPFREGQRSDEKDRKLSFYSGCASQFRYFKDAWRNHVAHMRDEYDRDQAHSILIHVRDFMERMSQRP